MIWEMDRRPRRRRHGDRAEQIALRFLIGLVWTVLATNVRAGRDELDVVAVEPGDAACLVFVEVRSNVAGGFGAPEESVVGGKLRRTYRGAWYLLRLGTLPDGGPLPRLHWRVGIVVVEQRPNRPREVGGPVVRHLRAVAPEWRSSFRHERTGASPVLDSPPADGCPAALPTSATSLVAHLTRVPLLAGGACGPGWVQQVREHRGTR